MPSTHRSVLLLVALLTGCGEPTPSTTSSSHWLTCGSDLDCNNLEESAKCNVEGYCETAAGERISRVLVFQDEFDGSALDASVWSIETGFGIRNDELQAYTDRAENVFLDNGELVLQALAETYDEATYTSGSVKTSEHGAWTYGRIEARILIPDGQGCWPAFWMRPNEPGAPEMVCVEPDLCFEHVWPAWGDITIMEALSQSPNTAGAVANYASSDEASAGLVHAESRSAAVLVGEPVAARYHTFAVEWGPQRIDWYLDGEQRVHSFDTTSAEVYHPSGKNPFAGAFYLQLNLALGGRAEPPVPDDYPQEMRVDWVRVWQYR